MKRTPLGATGMEVSEIAFGGVEIGIPYGFGVEEVMPEPQAIALLHAAREKGINFYDTARGYGLSEERIGKAFRDCRDDVIIATKCAHIYKDPNEIPPGELERFVEGSLAESLAALGTEYVDVFQIHHSSPTILRHAGLAKIFADIKARGAARAIGVSTYSMEDTRLAIEEGPWDVVQLAYHLMDQRQGEFFAPAEARGVGVLVRSVLFRGILTDRGRGLHPELKRIEDHRRRYLPLCEKLGMSLSDLATRFVLSCPEVSSVLVGMDRMDYLDSAVTTAQKHLDEATMQQLRGLAFPEAEWFDLPKWDRLGWLK